jgi:hypothetical protein
VRATIVVVGEGLLFRADDIFPSVIFHHTRLITTEIITLLYGISERREMVTVNNVIEQRRRPHALLS